MTETIALSLERYVEVKDPLAAALNMPGVTYSERIIEARVDELVALLGLDSYRVRHAGVLIGHRASDQHAA